MKIVVFSDAHGNILYLKKCFEKLSKFKTDKIFFLGDFVGYFDKVNEVIDLFLENNAKCVMGNHEAMLLGKLPLLEEKDLVYRLSNHRKILTRKNYDFINRLPDKILWSCDNKNILFIHGNPDNNLNGYLYENDNFAKYSNLDFDVIFMGNTHRPFIKTENNIMFINVGSCGMPRDIGNSPSFVLYDSENNLAQVIRVSVNIENFELNFPEVHPSVIQCLKR